MINYNVVGTGLSITPELRAYLEKGLSHAERFITADPPPQAAIELEFSQSLAGPKYRAEYTLSQGKEVYRAEARGETMHEAIDIAANELSRELTHAKRKRLRLFRRQSSKLKDFLRGLRDRF